MTSKYQNVSALIVEDDKQFAQVISDRLTKLGFKCFSCSKVVEAKLMLKNQKFDCIFLDMQLEQGSGESIIENIRGDAHGFNGKTPIIVMSGNLDLELVKRIKSKVNDILVKPFDPEKFIERVGSVIKFPEKTLETTMQEQSAAKNPPKN